MRLLICAVLALLVVAPVACAGPSPAVAGQASAVGPVLDHQYRPLARQQPVNLAQAHAGQVLLVVNTASKCGYTNQYEGLEA